MLKVRIIALVVLLIGIGAGYFLFDSETNPDGNFSKFPFKLGLDLSGGTHLVYRADVSLIAPEEVREAMISLRDVIERRVNLFGIAEPLVQVERTVGIITKSKEERLIVELPGVTDVDKATKMIGQTPLLEFKLETPDTPEKEAFLEELRQAIDVNAEGEFITNIDLLDAEDQFFTTTGLDGRFLKKATLVFDNITGEPSVLLEFDKEGAKLFAQITRENIGRNLAIYLDGAPISIPVIREEITGGSAEISGQFSKEEARTLVGRLNSGALPVPIELLSSQTIGASLGEDAKTKGVKAGILGLIVVGIFMIFWYRFPGLIAVVSLSIYIAIMLTLFKLIPVTLTSAGIAGFILSIGMAVDANVLIFERLKEELRDGRDLRESIHAGFKRAWRAIRDSNLSSIITAVILFWFGTSLVEGFALVFGIGVLVSMLTAITVTRTFLLALSTEKAQGITRTLFDSGFGSDKPKT